MPPPSSIAAQDASVENLSPMRSQSFFKFVPAGATSPGKLGRVTRVPIGEDSGGVRGILDPSADVATSINPVLTTPFMSRVGKLHTMTQRRCASCEGSKTPRRPDNTTRG
jgi:hypothetical protein